MTTLNPGVESHELGLSDKLASIKQLKDDAELLPIKINFLRNFTIEGIDPHVQFHALYGGINPTLHFGAYDNVQQEILDHQSHLHQDSPALIVLALHLENYLPDNWRNPWSAVEVMSGLTALFDSLAGTTQAIILANTFIPLLHADFGISAAAGLFSHHDELLRLNQMIRAELVDRPTRFLLCDWERYLMTLGAEKSLDVRFWYTSKAPFKQAFLDLYAQDIVKVCKALTGKTKKCLVLDCDNTLWGGVIGEDGIAGIKLSRHGYPGNVFYDFQKTVLKLHQRGTLICLSSKNNEQDVWDVLDKHPDCLLKREHLAAWRINWNDKATQLREIASDLNIGIDSLVFVDDSPMECGWVQETHPAVVVLQVPEKLYQLPQLLLAHGFFDTLSVNREDLQRAQMYQDQVQRKQGLEKFETMDQYLASLLISISVHRATPSEIPRIAQLSQKTNQFNLTTRRYSEGNIEAMCAAPDCVVLSLSVRDRFGDSGLTGVLIAKRSGQTANIDSLLLSCRVLGRTIEQAFVARSLSILKETWSIAHWQAEYIPSSKNQQVADFWSSLGFEKKQVYGSLIQFETPHSGLKFPPTNYIDVQE